MRLSRRELHARLLSLDDAPRGVPLEAVRLDRRSLDGRVDAVVQPGDGEQARRLQDLQILDESSDVSVEVADSCPLGERSLVGHATVDVGKREVGQMGVVGSNGVGNTGSGEASDRGGVRDDDSLGLPVVPDV